MDEGKIERMEQKKDRQHMKNNRKTENRAAMGAVFDKMTVEAVNRLITKGIIGEFVGILSSGKEANVYFAYANDGSPLAVKIYKIDPQNTKWMKNYIIGDPRFKKIGTATHKIIFTWCRKEFKNLTQMQRAGIPVPKPIDNLNNILVMEFIGESNGTPAQRLKDAGDFEDPSKELHFMLDQIRKMYLEAHLVHGDLSEYNILYFQNKQIIIDVSQAVSIVHNNAPVYLLRDVTNVIKFYTGMVPQSDLPDPEQFTHQIIQAQKAQ